MKFNKRNILNIIITLVIAFVYYYIFLPPINIHVMEFWIFLILMYLVYLVISLFTFIGYAALKGGFSSLKLSKGFKIMFAIIPGVFVLLII